jgi:hypothetical protein
MKRFLKFFVPRTLKSGGTVRESYWLLRNILYKYGWLQTKKTQECYNAAKEPIPWFTYPAIDYLSQFDFSDKEVFEYGSGYSTLFWSARAKKVVAVESYPAWFEKIKAKVSDNVSLVLSSNDRQEYANQIEKFDLFDIIVIDGIGESRMLCTQVAKKHLRSGGIIILDNSDLWVQSAEKLRADPDFIQVDFTGFAPFISNASTTSIFISRNADLKPLAGMQPHKSVAQQSAQWSEFEINH